MMRRLRLELFTSRVGSRAAVVTGSYVAAAAVILLTVAVLKHETAAPVLRGVLSFFFISSLSSGLEPGTTKAAFLSGVVSAGPGRGMITSMLRASALKAAGASPFLALLWRFTDPHLAYQALFLVPLIAIAGFAATDLRVLFDVERRHATAIWLKQGSLAGGLVIVAALVLLHVALIWAMACSIAARLALTAFAALWGRVREAEGEQTPRGARRLLTDVRWVELMAASVISAIGGSTDRILGLHYLPAATYASYFLLYELFSKFWVLPYVMNPILFARLLAGQESRAFIAGGRLLILAAGIGLILVLGAGFVFVPASLHRLLGDAFGPEIFAFAAAIILSAFTQLWMAYLTGSGATRRATVLIAVNTVISSALFFLLIRRFGLSGLFLGWLSKSVVELVLLSLGGRPKSLRGA
ncbi:MAG TPA: hypothetical protein VII63_01570 [Caulobacteraceae bacterium]